MGRPRNSNLPLLQHKSCSIPLFRPADISVPRIFGRSRFAFRLVRRTRINLSAPTIQQQHDPEALKVEADRHLMDAHPACQGGTRQVLEVRMAKGGRSLAINGAQWSLRSYKCALVYAGPDSEIRTRSSAPTRIQEELSPTTSSCASGYLAPFPVTITRMVFSAMRRSNQREMFLM